MLIGQARGVELLFELRVEDVLEQVLEPAVVDLQNRILAREVDGVLALQGVVEAGARKALDRFVEVEHRHGDAGTRCLEHVALDHGSAALGLKAELDRTGAVELDLGGSILVAESVTRDDYRPIPVGHDARHILADDGLPENRAVENIADGTVGAAPHLLQVEFLDASFVRGDGRAFHCYAVLSRGVGRVDRDLVVGLVSRLDPEIVVFQLDIEVGKNQLLADRPPDDPCHFVTVHLDERILDFDFAHGKLLQSRFERDRRCDLTAVAAAKTTGVPLLNGRYYSQSRERLRALPSVSSRQGGKIGSWLILKMKIDFQTCAAVANGLQC